MSDQLTELEQRVYHYMIDFLASNTYQPSIREIARQFHIKSTKTVSDLLHALERKGYIERDESRSRGVRLLGFSGGWTDTADPILRAHSRRHAVDAAGRSQRIHHGRSTIPSDDDVYLPEGERRQHGRPRHSRRRFRDDQSVARVEGRRHHRRATRRGGDDQDAGASRRITIVLEPANENDVALEDVADATTSRYWASCAACIGRSGSSRATGAHQWSDQRSDERTDQRTGRRTDQRSDERTDRRLSDSSARGVTE